MFTRLVPPPSITRSRGCALARSLIVAAALASGTVQASHLADEVAQVRSYVRLHPARALERLQALEVQARLASPDERGEYMTQLGYALLHSGLVADALATSERLLRLADAAHDQKLQVKGMLLKANALAGENQRARAHELFWQARSLALTLGDLQLRLQADILAAQAYGEAGRHQDALPILFAALDVARNHGMTEQTIAALQTLADAYDDVNDQEHGLAAIDEALAMAVKAGNDGQLATLRLTEFNLASSRGDMRRAIAALRSALAWAREHEVDEVAGIACANLADTYLGMHNPDAAYRYAGDALRLASMIGDDRVASFARLIRGRAALMLGRIDEGKRYLERAIAYTLRSGDQPQVIKDLDQYSSALELAGDTAGALSVARRARQLASEMDNQARIRAVAEVQGKYEARKRQERLDALERDNRARSEELIHQRRRLAGSIALAAAAIAAAIMMAVLLRRLRRAHAELRELSVRDPLTTLYNRRHFQELLAKEPTRGAHRRRHPEGTVGLLIVLDVDHFKRVNDTHGHAAGDAVLQAVAHGLRRILRETDMIVRWGGEEFLAYIEAVPQDDVDEVARRILAGIAGTAAVYQGVSIPVTVSLGFAQFRHDEGEVPLSRLITLADQALYLAKHRGRNRACGLRRVPAADAAGLDQIEHHLEAAAACGLIDLVTVTA